MTDDLLEALDPGPDAPDGAVEAVYVSRDGKPVAAVNASDVAFPWLCAGKPIMAAAMLRLTHEPGGPDLDDPVSRYVPELDRPDKRDIRISDLLTHRTGITREPIPRGWPDEKILGWIAGSPVEDTRGEPNYGMFSSWYLLGRVIERVTGRHRTQAADELVLRPLGLRVGFGGGGPAGRPEQPLLAAVDGRFDRPQPLGWITDPVVLEAAWAGVGMWGPMDTLARFYDALARPEEQSVPASLAAALADLGRPVGSGMRSWDNDTDDWSYSTGAYTGSAWIGRGFAHSVIGLDAATGTLGLADPVNGVVVVYGTTVMRLTAPVLVRRRRIVDAAYRACGLTAFPR